VDQRISAFLERRLRSFNPTHDEPSEATEPIEEWQIPYELLSA
jgi:hypothetical protein